MSRPFNTCTPLGEALRASGMSLRDLSYASGVNERTLSDYLADPDEPRHKPIRPHHLWAVADALDVTPDSLL